MSELLCVAMPLLNMKFLQVAVNSPSSTLSISLTNACIFLRARVKSLTSLSQQRFWALISLSFCASFPFDPPHQTSQPQYLRTFSELCLLFYSPLLFPSFPLLPSSLSWASALPMSPYTQQLLLSFRRSGKCCQLPQTSPGGGIVE